VVSVALSCGEVGVVVVASVVLVVEDVVAAEVEVNTTVVVVVVSAAPPLPHAVATSKMAATQKALRIDLIALPAPSKTAS
jgi:hypothetical protein